MQPCHIGGSVTNNKVRMMPLKVGYDLKEWRGKSNKQVLTKNIESVHKDSRSRDEQMRV